MAMRFLTGGGGLNSTGKTLGGLSRPFSAMISLSKTLSLSRPSFRHLSLSTANTLLNLSHRPLCVCLSLSFFSSLSATGQKKKLTFESLNGEGLPDDEIIWRTSLKRWNRSYFSSELNGMLDKFDRKTTNAWEMTEELRKEYNMKLEKLFEEPETDVEDDDEDEDDDYLLAEVKDLQLYFWNIIFNRSDTFYLGERVNKVLDWFDKEMTNAKEINEELRKDLEMMILKLANKKDEDDLQQVVEELAEMYWTLSINQAKAIRAKEASPDNLPWNSKSKPVDTDWQANNFIVLLNELLVWFEKETMEANETTQKLRKEYETFIAKLSAEERAADGDAGGNPWRRCFKELENMLWNLKKKQSKALVSKAKANKLADHQAMAAKLLYPFFVMALSPPPPPPLASLPRQKKLISDSVNELLDWFDNETMEANDTIQKLRKEYEIIVATLLAEDRPVLMEDVEDLQDFNWELSVKSRQASKVIFDNKLSSGYRTKARQETIRSRRTDITGRDWITCVWERHVSDHFYGLEDDMMKVKEKTEKLRKDHEMMAQKLLLANDEEDEAVLMEELNEMFFNLSENKAKAIQAKANAAKAHRHKAEDENPMSFIGSQITRATQMDILDRIL